MRIRNLMLAVSLLIVWLAPRAPLPRLAAAEGEGAAAEETAAQQQAPSGLRLTLSDAINMALSSNLDLRVSGYDPLMLAEDIDHALSEFDPTVTGTFSYSSQREPSFSTIIPTTRTRTSAFDFGLEAKVLSGAFLTLSAGNAQTRTNNFFLSSVSPFYRSELSIGFTQPLLRNAGVDVNRTGIVIAQNNFRIGVHQFREQVMQLVLDVTDAYWTLLFRREDLKAKERSLEAAQDFLRNTRIKAEAGAVAPIEVTRARARAADRQQAIVTARALIKDAEDELRRLLSPQALALRSSAEIIPVDTPTVHAEQLELGPSLNYALSSRPRILSQRVALESYDILLARAKNQLLPQVDLLATYQLNGLGSTWHDDFEMIGTLDMPNASAGLALSIPLGNRRARSQYSRTRYERLQALAAYAALERDVTLSVKKAIRDVATSLQSIETNTVRVEASQAQLEAERQKFDVGQSISLDVLDAQDALQQAESALIASIVQFKRAMANYRRQTGSILEANNVRILPPANLTRNGQPLFP